MNRDSVHIDEIQIHRALGVRQGEGFALDDVSPGINLIFGPNGSGKTTTCRVVQEVLWPGHVERPSMRAVLRDGGDEWSIEVDAGHRQVFQNGRPGAAPDFGSNEHRKRYLLGLGQLFVDNNDDFARAIAEASQGGYDLEKAADGLAFKERQKSRKSEAEALNAAERAADAARRKQEAIQDEAARLAELRQQLDQAIDAGRKADLLTKAREHQLAVERCKEVEIELTTFPEGVARLRGDEREQLDRLAEEEAALKDQRTATEERLSAARAELERLDLPEGGLSDDVLRGLRASRRTLKDVEAQVAEEQRRRAEAVVKVEEALRRLGGHLTEDQLAQMDSVENVHLSELARRVHRLRAREEVLHERQSWLGQEEPDDCRDVAPDDLREGISLLTYWLGAAGPGESEWRPSWPSILVAVAAVLIAAALGLQVLLLLVTGVAAVVLVLAVDWFVGRKLRNSDVPNARGVHRAAYEQLALQQPSHWDEKAVLALLRELVALSAKKALYEERRARRELLRTEVAAVEQARAEVDSERTSLENRLGVSIEMGEEWLPVLVDQIREWQRASAQLATVEAGLAAPERQRAELLDRVNERLAEYEYPVANSSDDAQECIDDLERRRSTYESAKQTLEAAEVSITESIEPAIAAIVQKRREIFERLGLEENEAHIFDEWLEQRSRYQELTAALAREEAIRDDRAEVFADRPELKVLSRAEIESDIAECEAAAARRDELNETIGKIKERIEEAKAGHALTDALEHRDEARQALAAARHENARSAVGAALTQWVRREAVEHSRPQVFQRANELFVRFTRGTHRLEMDDRATPPSIMARRGNLPIQSLNELSDGERIQLMTAVRLAFLEQGETKRLPLLVDEVLGTSDDGRSGVLIDTMIEIARQGRQVFYCTAQHDEVGKWKAKLKTAGVPHRILDLGEIRGGAAYRSEPAQIAVFESTSPPEPNGMTYQEYRAAIGVQDLEPSAETTDRVHLWHLLDDTHLLFELLCKDITTWGQLQTLIDHGGAGLVDVGNGTYDRVRAAGKAIRAACDGWKIGRGKKVDRSILLDSDCVSDRFIDEVAALAVRVGGDAEEIVRCLENKEVSNWRSDNTERLRDYFESEGYVALQSPLTPRDVRVRVLASVADELKSGVLEHAFVDRIVGGMYSSSELNVDSA